MNIVVLDGGTLNPGDISWKSIENLGTMTIYDQSTQSQIVERSKNADIIIVNKVKVTSNIIDQLPQLKYIAVSATGYNNVDVSHCFKKNIPVSNVSNYGSDNVAQHVFALMLALTNQVETHDKAIKNGTWQKKNAFTFWESPLIELSQKTIGIIGWGNIGRKVGKIADGFNMNVLVHSNSQSSGENRQFVSLNDLLLQSDFITLNTHLNTNNYKMVNRLFLQRMKSSAYLINTSRGDLINESELADALKSNTIAGAALDVLSAEPPLPTHPLLNLENCILTPHNAWASIEARQRLMTILSKNIESYLGGQPINLIKE